MKQIFDQDMQVQALEVRLLRLPLRVPFKASHGQMDFREVTVVKAETTQGVGWGECSALTYPTYSAESAQQSYEHIRNVLGPMMLATPCNPTTFSESMLCQSKTPMAIAALEMALIDALLKTQNTSLSSALGVKKKEVAAGVVIGMETTDTVLQKSKALAEQGYTRIKLKIAPGHDREILQLVTEALPEIAIQVDANGAYESHHIEHLVSIVTDLNIEAVEQPFKAEDAASAQKFLEKIQALPNPPLLVADEAATDLASIESLLATKTANAIVIKPSRLGGIFAARKVHNFCLENKVPAIAGGMLESGLGRHALAALAGLPGFTITGDLSPAKHWLLQDPWNDIEKTESAIAVPTTAGVAPTPAASLLKQTTQKMERINL